jgi:uncharacterized protein YggE
VDGKVTVSVRTVLLAALAALGLVVAYLLGSSGSDGGAPATAAETTAGSESPGIEMTGRGQATAVPDQLSFGLSVTAKRDDLEDALDDSSATMKRVLASLEEYGVEEKDIQTTGLSMSPEYQYPAYGPPVLTGYRVTQQARVTVTDLGEGGRAISAAVDAGGNDVRVHSIKLGIADPSAAIEEARDAAVAEAMDKAEQYAAATGRQLGDVVSIREVSAPPRIVEQAISFDRAAIAAKAVPIRAGEQDLTVRVHVVWSLE